MRKVNKPAKPLKLPLTKVARSFRRSLPATELPTYDAYLAHIGRRDIVSASNLADQRIGLLLQSDVEPHDLAIVYQAYSLCSKISLAGDQRAEEAAWQKYCQVETKCKYTNRKMRYLMMFPFRSRKVLGGDDLSPFRINRLREIIAEVLGSFQSAYGEICTSPHYGPGMSLSSRSASCTSLPFKLRDDVTITANAVPVWRDFIRENFMGFPHLFDLVRSPGSELFRVRERVACVPGCRITFVDKTSVIKRTIAIEPSANVVMQLAVHAYLRKRLLKVAGIDIGDQTRNRSLALEGSRSGTLGTIDLSSASDSVAKEVIKFLFPADWFELLNSLRSPTAEYKGQVMELEKFSSMGNGFTFALETVLFYALTKLACENVSIYTKPCVYGDDIIVPTPAYDSTISILQRFGFKVNTKKSFNAGPFRESCGLDAYKGVDVRPVFPKTLTPSVVELFALHNRFFLKGHLRACEALIRALPERFRLYGPQGPTDAYLFTQDGLKHEKNRKWDKDTQQYLYSGLIEQGKRQRYPQFFLLNSTLLKGGVYSNGAPLRYRTELVRVTVPGG